MCLVMHSWLDAGVWQAAPSSSFAITSTAAPCKTPSCTSPGGWTCPSSCLERGGGGGAVSWREELLWFLAAKRCWSLHNTSCCPQMPSLQQLPTHSTRHCCKLGCPIRFFFLLCHHQVAHCFILCFKLCGQAVHRNLHSQSWTTVIKSFPTTIFSVIQAPVTRITSCRLWQLQGTKEMA